MLTNNLRSKLHVPNNFYLDLWPSSTHYSTVNCLLVGQQWVRPLFSLEPQWFKMRYSGLGNITQMTVNKILHLESAQNYLCIVRLQHL